MSKKGIDFGTVLMLGGLGLIGYLIYKNMNGGTIAPNGGVSGGFLNDILPSLPNNGETANGLEQEPKPDAKPITLYKIPNISKELYVPLTKTQQTFVTKVIPMIKETKTLGYTPNKTNSIPTKQALAIVKGTASQYLGTSYTNLISKIKGYKK